MRGTCTARMITLLDGLGEDRLWPRLPDYSPGGLWHHLRYRSLSPHRRNHRAIAHGWCCSSRGAIAAVAITSAFRRQQPVQTRSPVEMQITLPPAERFLLSRIAESSG